MTILAPRHSERRTAFTLIELIVTIGIIVLLAAITVSAMVALGRRSETTRTENTLRLLDLALAEWETTAGRKPRWGLNPDPDQPVYDMDPNTPDLLSTSELLRTLRRNENTGAIIAQIDPSLVYKVNPLGPQPLWLETDPSDPDPNAAGALGLYQSGEITGELVILDGWERPIRAVHPGRLFAAGDPQRDPDGTIRTAEENIYGVALNRRVLFVSAGPDQRFGDRSSGTPAEPDPDALDNIYSYEPQAPEATP